MSTRSSFPLKIPAKFAAHITSTHAADGVNFVTFDPVESLPITGLDLIDYVTGIGNGAFRASGPCCAQNAIC